MAKHDELSAPRLAALCGKLAGALEWCVKNPGECLGDHPEKLSIMKEYLRLTDACAAHDAAALAALDVAIAEQKEMV